MEVPVITLRNSFYSLKFVSSKARSSEGGCGVATAECMGEEFFDGPRRRTVLHRRGSSALAQFGLCEWGVDEYRELPEVAHSAVDVIRRHYLLAPAPSASAGRADAYRRGQFFADSRRRGRLRGMSTWTDQASAESPRALRRPIRGATPLLASARLAAERAWDIVRTAYYFQKGLIAHAGSARG